MKFYFGGGAFFGAIAFLAGWVYCIAEYGFLLGGSLGWFPSAILAFVVAWIWPLLALAIAFFAYAMVEGSDPGPSKASHSEVPALRQPALPSPRPAGSLEVLDPLLEQTAWHKQHDAWHAGWGRVEAYEFWHKDWHQEHDTKYLTHASN